MKKLFAILAFAAASALPLAPAQAVTTLHIDSWISPRHLMNAVVFKTWGEWVKKASHGRLDYKISYPPKTHPKTMFDRARKGISDVVWSFHGYTPGRFVLTQVVELPGLGASAREASIAYWKIHQKYLAKANEHKGVKLLAVFSHGPGAIHTKIPITSPVQLRDMKIRVGGGVMSQIAHNLGVIAVSAPATKVYQILSQGVADGVFMPMETKVSLKLTEVAPYSLLLPGGLYYGSFFMAMSPSRYNSLSKEDRAVIDAASGARLAAMAGKAWADYDVAATKKARALGNTITMASIPLQDDFYAKMDKAGLEKHWIAAANAKGVDGRAALDALRAEVKKLQR